MNTYKYFFLSTLTFLLFFMSPMAVRAQEGPVATVNIQDANILTQSGNTFNIAFKLSNREGVQSGVKYGVQLIAETSKGQIIVDEKIFDETLTLLANSTESKEIVYFAPPQLNGSYKLFLTSRNENGFPFGVSLVGEVDLVASTAGIVIDPTSCSIKINGSGRSFALSQSPSLDAGQFMELSCSAKNMADTEISAVPFFETRAQSAYGEVVGQEGGSSEPISFRAGETKPFEVTLPKGKNPQQYIVTAGLSFDSAQSNTVTVQYVIEGMSATITNLSFDKDTYQKGETAEASILWHASVENDAELVLSVQMKNALGRSCASPITQTISRSSQKPTVINIPITTSCNKPVATVTISTNDGMVLDQEDFSIKTPGELLNKKTVLLLLIGILLLLGFVIFLKRRHPSIAGEKLSAGNGVIIFLLFLLGSMVPFSEANADTYYYTTTQGETIETVANLDSAVYLPSTSIRVTARIGIVESNPSGAYKVNLFAANNTGTSTQIIPTLPQASTVLSYLNSNTGYYIYNSFVAPTAPGSYAVNFITGVDNSATLTNGQVIAGPGGGGTYDSHVWCTATIATPSADGENIIFSFNAESESTGPISNQLCDVNIPAGETYGDSYPGQQFTTGGSPVTDIDIIDYCFYEGSAINASSISNC